MPMSEEAAAGLRAAVEWNPAAARYFMHILRDLPIGVRYKEQDRYGPLALMISAYGQTQQITSEISIPLQNFPPFPEEKLKLCEAFNAEWLQRRFTKQELADAIEQILREVEPRPLFVQVDPHATLIFKASGTYLYNPGDETDTYKKI